MPFNKDVGSTITYQAAKVENWQPGDYTKFVNPPKNRQYFLGHFRAFIYIKITLATVTAVFHNPYNTPIGLYSDNNVFNAFSHQTKNIINSDAATRPNINPEQALNQRNINSLSMKMLNKALNETEGTNGKIQFFQFSRIEFCLFKLQNNNVFLEQPPSVFDLKSGNNPTGATIPQGFRSVQAPVNKKNNFFNGI